LSTGPRQLHVGLSQRVPWAPNGTAGERWRMAGPRSRFRQRRHKYRRPRRAHSCPLGPPYMQLSRVPLCLTRVIYRACTARSSLSAPLQNLPQPLLAKEGRKKSRKRWSSAHSSFRIPNSSWGRPTCNIRPRRFVLSTGPRQLHVGLSQRVPWAPNGTAGESWRMAGPRSRFRRRRHKYRRPRRAQIPARPNKTSPNPSLLRRGGGI
jgi:hypothetical protein